MADRDQTPFVPGADRVRRHQYFTRMYDAFLAIAGREFKRPTERDDILTLSLFVPVERRAYTAMQVSPSWFLEPDESGPFHGATGQPYLTIDCLNGRVDDFLDAVRRRAQRVSRDPDGKFVKVACVHKSVPRIIE